MLDRLFSWLAMQFFWLEELFNARTPDMPPNAGADMKGPKVEGATDDQPIVCFSGEEGLWSSHGTSGGAPLE